MADERHAVVLSHARKLLERLALRSARTRLRPARSTDELSPGERELRSIEATSAALAAAGDVQSVARILLDEVSRLLSVEVAGLVIVNVEATEARGLLARREGEDVPAWSDLRFDLRRDPSGVASAVVDGTPVTVDEASASPPVDEAVRAIGAKSAVFVPLVSGTRVIAVLVIASTSARRVFSAGEVGLVRTLAAAAAVALAHTRSVAALEEAVERERLLSSIAHRLRSERDLESGLRVALDEIASVLGLSRCFVCLGADGKTVAVEAEATAPGLEPVPPDVAVELPLGSEALRTCRTVTLDDVEREPDRVGAEALRRIGTRSGLATPIVLLEQAIGALVLHRAEPHTWTASERAFAEAAARELGLCIQAARLVREHELRLGQQRALLQAAQVVTGELDVETVLQLLVDRVAELLDADAADCYLFEPDRSTLRCVSVRGFDPGLVGFSFPAGNGLAGRAIAEGRAVTDHRYGSLDEPVPHPAYEGFAAAMVAPLTWAGETRGVLGVGVRSPSRIFGDRDAEALASFATIAALALRNAESFRQRERQAAVERGFFRIASLLAEPVSLTATLDAVANAAAEAFAGDRAAVLVSGPEGFRLGGGHDLPAELRELFAAGIPGGAEALVHAATEGRTLASSHLADDERFSPEFRAAVAAGALLAIPIAAPRARREALTVVFFPEPRSFSGDDFELADQLAARAQVALERSELFEGERRSRVLAQQLAETGSLFSGELEPGAVLDEVVEQAPVLLGADAASIRLLEGDELVAAAASGPGSERAVGVVPADARPGGAIVESRAPVAIEDVAGDESLLEGEPMLAHGYAAYLGVPLLRAEGDLLGVLAVYNARPRRWREEEVEALGALAANASVAYSKAELYQQVELERERSVAILANVADGIVAVDREELIVLWNAAAERITGVPAEEAVGRTVHDVLQRELRSSSPAGSGDRLVPIRRGDREVWLSLTEAVMRDPAGETAGRIFAFRDISAERVVEQMRSDFVSTVSHELRAPLTSIYGFAATLLRDDVAFTDQERRTFLGYIESEAQRLTGIVDKLLNVARLDAGDLELELTPVDVRSLVSEVVEVARADTGANGHEFVVDLPDSPLAARTDAEKLRQVLANLVDNAVRFSPNGGRVTVGAARRGETLVLSVVDQGVGIPAVEQQRIFSKFYRVGAAQTGGTGVGLFIAQGLVSALGGRITVRSAEGLGSSFVVELPAREGDGGGG